MAGLPRILAIAPTLADAVMSVGGTLARHVAAGHEVAVVTLAAAEQAQDAAVQLGIETVIAVAAEGAAVAGEDAVLSRLAVVLARAEPELVLTPLGLHGGEDANLIERLLGRLDVPRLRWADLPYSLSRTSGAPLGAGTEVAVPIARQIDAKLAACTAIGGDAPLERLREHAVAEGRRLGAGGPVEVLLAPPEDDGRPRTAAGGRGAA